MEGADKSALGLHKGLQEKRGLRVAEAADENIKKRCQARVVTKVTRSKSLAWGKDGQRQRHFDALSFIFR